MKIGVNKRGGYSSTHTYIYIRYISAINVCSDTVLPFPVHVLNTLHPCIIIIVNHVVCFVHDAYTSISRLL